MIIKYYTDDGLLTTEYYFDVEQEKVDKFLKEMIEENKNSEWMADYLDDNGELREDVDPYEEFIAEIKEHFKEDFRKWLMGED